MPKRSDRRCIALRDTSVATELTAPLNDVVWVGERYTQPNQLKKLLGASYDAVVLDLRSGFNADVLAQCHGFVRAGGALILLLPPEPPSCAHLAVWPHTADDVTDRLYQRLLQRIPPPTLHPLAPDSTTTSTADQQRAIDTLTTNLSSPLPTATVLAAGRGRGKSAALGLALALHPGAVITGPSVMATAQACRFANLPHTALHQLPEHIHVLAVDEAAQIPVPTLQRLVREHPTAHLAFATTTRGYEGTGRGFVLRFMEWLRQQDRPLTNISLTQPIRFGSNDPLENLVDDVLMLSAQPASTPVSDDVEVRRVDRNNIEPAHLEELFGLLVHAHYRTTPEDLHRLLDAPNMRIHAAFSAGHIVAATLLALEGGLTSARSHALTSGELRIRGHALPDNLCCHLGHPEAGPLTMVRSVRIATHPDHRRRGLAAALVEHVHSAYEADLFGTLFGATTALVRFRRSVGYRLVRIGSSRGARTGEPSAVMLHPVSQAAKDLTQCLRSELARDLPLQLTLLQADADLDPGLPESLVEDLPEPAPITTHAIQLALARYAAGPAPYEAVATLLTAYLTDPSVLASLPDPVKSLVERRVLERKPWNLSASKAGYSSTRAAMRALKRALAELQVDAAFGLR